MEPGETSLVGDEENDELLWGCSETAVKLFSFADVCEHTYMWTWVW